MKTAILLAMLCCAAAAADLKLRDGKVLFDYEVVRVYPDGLSINHREGATRIPMEDMPPELAAKYKFDEAKAKEFREQKAAARATAVESRKAAGELKPEEPATPEPRVQSAEYWKKGGGVKLPESLIKELNDLLEKCPRAARPQDPKGGCVYYGIPKKWIECKPSGLSFSVDLVEDSFRLRFVPVELRPRVKEVCRKLDRHWSESKASTPAKKKKSR